VNDDLTRRIGALPDEDAIVALVFVLDVEDASNQDVAQLRTAEEMLPEAFATTPDLAEITAPVQGTTAGDLARTALIYLAGQEPTSELVSNAVERPCREGQRDPLSFAIGGLVLLALKTDVELKRTTSGKWSFHFRLKPTKDSALAGILAKLWTLYGGGGGSAHS
jgi:hypothetical protein